MSILDVGLNEKRRNTDLDFESLKQLPKIMPLSPTKMHQRLNRAVTFKEEIKVEHKRKVKQCKVFNFDESDILDRKAGFELKLKLNCDPTYPCNDKLYSSPKIIEYIRNCSSRRNSLKQMFMKNTIMVNPFKEDVYSLGLILLETLLLLSNSELEDIKKRMFLCRSSKERKELLQHECKSLKYTNLSGMIKLLCHCLNPDSNERPTFNVLLILMLEIKNSRADAMKEVSEFNMMYKMQLKSPRKEKS